MLRQVPPYCLYLLGWLLLVGCYEERVGCLDPDANNYSLGADEACPACCTYPSFSIRLTTVWEDGALTPGTRYADGTGDTFQLVDFRYYLGDLRLVSSVTELGEPQRPVDLQEQVNSEVRDVTLNGNYLLAGSSRSSSAVGSVRLGTDALTGLAGTYGLPERYRNVLPRSAPTGDALRTQPRQLNYLDGRGYVQARLEYTLPPETDTLSVSTFASAPFALSFPDGVVPLRGADVLVDVEADLHALIGELDLSADSATIAGELTQPVDFLRATGITF